MIKTALGAELDAVAAATLDAVAAATLDAVAAATLHTVAAATLDTGTTATLDIVLPCLDEADALPWVLARVPAGARAIVVDNGSSDGSPDVARAAGATVVHAERRGYGAACDAGLRAATAPMVAFCDCDASLDPADAMRLAEPVAAGQADLTVARRRALSRAAWPFSARVANYELARRIRRRTALPITDLGPLRVARRQAWLDLGVADRRSGYPLEQLLRAAAAGWRIQQLDVVYHPRVGRSKVTGTVRGSLRAVRDMRAVLAERAPA